MGEFFCETDIYIIVLPKTISYSGHPLGVCKASQAEQKIISRNMEKHVFGFIMTTKPKDV